LIAAIRLASQGLAFRIAALLAVALIPIGVIATIQTVRVFERADRAAEANLLALTGDAATGEEALFRAAFGAAQAIAAYVPSIEGDEVECQRVLQEFLRRAGSYSYAGYVNREGVVSCASSGMGTDVRNRSVVYADMRADPRPRAAVNRDAPISRESVVVLATPLIDRAGEFDGYVSISLPHSEIFRSFEEFQRERPVDLITFNGDGQVLSAEGGLDGVDARLPAGAQLVNYVGRPQVAFTGRNRAGELRVFAIVPIVANTVYALGSWEYRQYGYGAGLTSAALPILFPVLMWIASLGVAFLAVERMVIRPIRNLRARMLVFMRSRHIAPQNRATSVPVELREMNDTWERMAESVLRDEAELQDTIHDRDVLLKEVHHRVKNNLQLIASILNLKIRKSRTPEARHALADIQARVMSLATVHRSLYESTGQGRIRVDELLRGITGKTIEATLTPELRVAVEQSYDPVSLYPDQAVPLTLAAAEAVTNSLKYMGRRADGSAMLSVRLKRRGEEVEFEVVNSRGTPIAEDMASQPGESAGLGEQLIRGFAQQLDGNVETEVTDDTFRLRVILPLVPFAGETTLPPGSVTL